MHQAYRVTERGRQLLGNGLKIHIGIAVSSQRFEVGALLLAHLSGHDKQVVAWGAQHPNLVYLLSPLDLLQYNSLQNYLQ